MTVKRTTTSENEDPAEPGELGRAQDFETDPRSEPVEPEKVVTMDDLGIGPRDPYPTGNPPTTDLEAHELGARLEHSPRDPAPSTDYKPKE